jgi:eukaryotic-like serine/threonine-protein kinase
VSVEPGRSPSPSPTLAGRVDGACDRFEADWKAGRRPRIEDYLGGSDGAERAARLRELLALEVEFRRRRGDRPAPSDYEARFPGEGPIIGEVLGMGRIAAGRPATPAGADPTADSSFTSTAPESAGPDDPGRRHADGPAPGGPRFLRVRPLARGGLGEVYEARDAELNRRVALKEIQGRHADDPDSRARFLLEAEVTGGLEHPGIVPVYGLGRHPDGRPYYAMRLVRGETFTEAIRRYHRHRADGGDPGAGALEFRGLLRRFVDVCNAIAYAHSQGVIHRDLKPDNVMLGQYGETLVVDWGLAKVIGKGAPGLRDDEEPVKTASAGGGAETLPGKVLGTPQYMSPEQAAGDPGRLGFASDVYGLGATLFRLLTGRHPVEGPDISDLLGRIRRGEIPPARQVNRAVPPALEAVCRKAMALDPADRYESARALAEDVERWLADEPVSAWREPRADRLRRWGRRHRPLAAGAAGLLIAATVASAVAAALLGRANARAEARRLEAVAARGQAERNLARAREAAERYYTRISEDRLLNEPHMAGLRKDLLATARDYYQQFVAEHRDDPRARADLARASVRLSKIAEALGATAEALEHGRRGRALLDELVAAYPLVADYRDGLVGCLTHLGQVEMATGRTREAEASLRRAVALSEGLVAEHPEVARHRSDLAIGLYDLGVLLRSLGRVVEAEAAGRRALATLERLAAEDPDSEVYADHLAATCTNLGILCASTTGRLEEAETFLGRAMRLREALAVKHPEVARYRGEWAAGLSNLGNYYRMTGRGAPAESSHRKALEIRERLAAEHPEVVEYRRNVATSHLNLGNLYAGVGRAKEAEAAYRRALALETALAAEHPERVELRRNLAVSHNNLGDFYTELRRFDEAEGHLKEALAIRERLAAEHPEPVEHHVDLGASGVNLGNLAAERKDFRSALAWYGRAIAAGATVRRREPRNASARACLVKGYWGRALALSGLDRHAEAAEDFGRAAGFADGAERDQLRLYRASALARGGDPRGAVAEAEAVAESRSIPPGPRSYDVACALALASAAIGDGSGSESGRWAARAVAQLARARDAGYFRDRARIAHLDADPDLRSLRPRSDYRAFRLDLGLPADPFAK